MLIRCAQCGIHYNDTNHLKICPHEWFPPSSGNPFALGYEAGWQGANPEIGRIVNPLAVNNDLFKQGFLSGAYDAIQWRRMIAQNQYNFDPLTTVITET